MATRFPYNTNLTEEGLKKVEQSEEIIKSIGIQKVRVRVHDNIARIEVNPEDFEIILNNITNKNKETRKEKNTKNQNQENILDKIKALGFSYVTLELSGLKSGSFD